MKSAKSTSVNGSTVYYSGAADLEEPFDQIAAEINRGIAEDLPEKSYVVSGSAVLRLFIKYVRGEEPAFEETDVDVYAETQDKYRDLVVTFTREIGAEYDDHSERSVAFRLGGRVYDFVSWRHGGLFDVITTHDLSTCGIGVTVDDKRTRVFAVTEEFVSTMNDNNLRLQHGFERADAVSVARTVDRIFKYKARGFRPAFGLLNELAKHIYSKEPEEAKAVNNVAEQVAQVTASDSSE